MALWLTTKFLALTTSAISLPLLTGLGVNGLIKKDGEKSKKVENDSSKEELINELRKQECQQQRNRQRVDKDFRSFWGQGASHYLEQSYQECMSHSSKNKIEKTKSKEEIMSELRKQECERQKNLQQANESFWRCWGRGGSHYLLLSYQQCIDYKDEEEEEVKRTRK